MKLKLYTGLRLTLGSFIMLGIVETGNALIENCGQAYSALANNAVTTLKIQEQPIQSVIDYCSQLMDSTSDRLS